MVDHRSGPRHICPITLFFPGNAATRILEHETTFRLAMVTAPMRRLPIPLLMSNLRAMESPRPPHVASPRPTGSESDVLCDRCKWRSGAPARRPPSAHPQRPLLSFFRELATAARPAGIIAKTSRRVAVALTMSIGVGLLMMSVWRSSPSSLFLRTIILGLSATAAFALFEVWPRSLPRWLQRWALQVVAVGVFMPVTTLLIYVLSTPRGAPPFWENPTG